MAEGVLQMSEENIGTTNATTEPVTTPLEATTNSIEIDYLGNKETISLDDVETVKALLQKGKDYQRIHDKYESAKTKLSKAEEVARIYGYRDENGQGTVDEFLETVKQNFDSQQIDSLVSSGMTESEAKELLELRQEKEEFKRTKQEYEAKELKKKNDLDFMEYFKLVNHREFTTEDKIPPEVLKAEKQGVPLKYAYADYLAREVSKKAEIEKVNAENKETSAPSMSSTAPDKVTFTEEEVKGMSRADVQKNWSVIAKSMKLPSWKK